MNKVINKIKKPAKEDIKLTEAPKTTIKVQAPKAVEKKVQSSNNSTKVLATDFSSKKQEPSNVPDATPPPNLTNQEKQEKKKKKDAEKRSGSATAAEQHRRRRELHGNANTSGEVHERNALPTPPPRRGRKTTLISWTKFGGAGQSAFSRQRSPNRGRERRRFGKTTSHVLDARLHRHPKKILVQV